MIDSEQIDIIVTGLENCSGSGENCNCPYSDMSAGSCVSVLCCDALALILELLDNMNGYTRMT